MIQLGKKKPNQTNKLNPHLIHMKLGLLFVVSVFLQNLLELGFLNVGYCSLISNLYVSNTDKFKIYLIMTVIHQDNIKKVLDCLICNLELETKVIVMTHIPRT